MMKKILKYKKIIILILAIMTILLTIGNSAKAVIDDIVDTSKKVSLTITKYEHANGSEENVELAGAEFTIYLVDKSIDTVEEAEEYITNNDVISYTKTTPENGTIIFSDLEQGRYFVVETKAPKNAIKAAESFLIDLPRTSDDGTNWEYDVTVYPKNITIYGEIRLHEVTEDYKAISGNEWKIQKLNDDGKWEDYSTERFITDEEGNFIIENLEIGKYRLVEESVQEGYIIESPIEVDITQERRGYAITKTSQNLNVEKYVLLDDGNYGKDIGKFTTDIISWKTVAKVPTVINEMDKYVINDIIDEGLVLDNDSIHIYGADGNGNEWELSNDCYVLAIDGQNINIDFATNNLVGYRNVIIKYDTKFDDTVKNGEYKTNVNLTYIDHIDENGDSVSDYTTETKSAEVHTGSVLILKTDNKQNPLHGAIFKIATSKENAENGVFVKDLNGNDIIAISNEKGYVIFDGLKFGEDDVKTENAITSYWIVEVQAPSYEENGETKYYSLLDKAVEVQVDSSSGVFSTEDTTTVVNKKDFTLPLTGGTLSLISTILGIIFILIPIIIIKKKSNNSKVEKIEKNN